MEEEELRSVPILKTIDEYRNELTKICQEINSTIITRIGEEWQGKDGTLFREQFIEVYNIAIQLLNSYDEIELCWKKYLKNANHN